MQVPPPPVPTHAAGPAARFRLTWALPLGVLVVLGGTASALALVANVEVRRLAEEAAGERLRTPVNELANALAAGPRARLEAVRSTAGNPAIRDLLRGNRRAAPAARLALQQLQRESGQRDGVELFSRDGTVILSVEAAADSLRVPLAVRRAPKWTEADSTNAWISEIQIADSIQWIDLTASVGDAEEPAGYLVRRRRIVPANPQSVRLVRNLIGADSRFSVGSAETGWSDLRGGQLGPSAADYRSDSALVYRTKSGREMFGLGTRVAGTPWHVWVETPRERVLATTRPFLKELLWGGLLVVAIGVALGTALSRALTAPLAELTAAAEAVAGGDLSRRVIEMGPAEVGSLSRSFNRMAEQVSESRRSLEARVAERTDQLESLVKQLSESEARFRQLATSTPDAIIISDGDGRIAYINPAGERLFGYDTGALQGQPVTVLVPPQYRSAHAEGHGNYMRTGVGRAMSILREVSALRKDGTSFPAEISVTGWAQGGSHAVAAILRDITERRRLSDSLAQHARQLEEANAELAAFSYSVSHDLRAPLRSIHGFTQALLEDHSPQLNSEGRDYARRVNAAAQRMSHLIDDLLELSRVSRTGLLRQPVDLVPLTLSAIAELRQREPERRVEFVHPSSLSVEGDERLLRQVVQNLLENAWKFTSRADAARIELSCERRGAESVISLRDNGVGFDPRFSNKLFGVFQRLHRDDEFPGTGVGLAIVQRIVHRHGGRVWAESALGEGASFFFTLGTGEVTV